ncbi:MAG: ATP-dependent helicase HrpB, partial [Acidimicrobiia bacterium]
MSTPVWERFGRLPIHDVLGSLGEALTHVGTAVLVAPPGAGKTTVVPLWLISGEGPLAANAGRVLVLEPRRVAARGAAARMADMLGETVGRTVGVRMRGDSRVSRATRIEVVTEGVFTRMILDDPSLPGVAAVLFDEVHERNLATDVGLALTVDARSALRPDLLVVAMSATVDAAAFAALLGDAPVIAAEGRMFPIDTVHVGGVEPDWQSNHALLAAVADAAARTAADIDGDVLVFLPGRSEIRRVGEILRPKMAGTSIEIVEMHGSLSISEQQRVIAGASTDDKVTPRIILSTSIAETSVTIDGVRAVVDSGLARVPTFDVRRGLPGLATQRVSRAAADQRRGRAGRTGPGRCVRLWSQAQDARLLAEAPPEITVADLAPLALDLAEWGDPDGEHLSWLTAPGPRLSHARVLLHRLGLVDDSDRITAHGREVARLGLHPRLGHLLVRGAALGGLDDACDLAALLSASGPRRRATVDIEAALGEVRSASGDPAIGRESERLRRRLSDGARGAAVATAPLERPSIGELVALAYPDRLARRRERGRFVTVDGTGVSMPSTDPLADSPFLAVAEIDRNTPGPNASADASVRLAAPLSAAEAERVAGDAAQWIDEIVWDRSIGDVRASRELRLGAVVLRTGPVTENPGARTRALLDGIAIEGLGLLDWTDEARRLRNRMALCHRLDPVHWPDVSDQALLADLDGWLGPRLASARNRADLARIDVSAALSDMLDWPHRTRLVDLAPESVIVPSGRTHRIDYENDPPVLAVKLQELFGLAEAPTIGGGAVRLVLHLLSPAGRPLAVTSDLTSFWNGPYLDVRREMRG